MGRTENVESTIVELLLTSQGPPGGHPGALLEHLGGRLGLLALHPGTS